MAEPLIIYVVPGSQFSGKVLAALDACGVHHYAEFVSLQPSKRKLPSGGTLVPELKCGEHAVPDSEEILKWVDKHRGTRLFPSAEAGELSRRASSGRLAGLVLYYNWIDPEGYAKTMRRSIGDALPGCVPCKGLLADFLTKSKREEFRAEIVDMVGVTWDALDPENEAEMHGILVAELEFFQGKLSTGWEYLGGTKPTAADFSVYAQVERLVGDMGDANIPCSQPELLQERRLERFWEWHRLMCQRHPIKFKGKRAPKE